MMEEKRKINNLELLKIEHKELSIQFSLDGFSFCVYDLDLQEFVAFYKYEFSKVKTPEQLLDAIKQLFVSENNLRITYDKVKVIHHNNLISFVPKVMFDEANLSEYVSFNNKIYNNDFFAFDTIINQEMNAVYIPYVNINNFFIDQYGSFLYKHASSILVEKLLNQFSKSHETTFFVNVNKTDFQIIISKNKKLLFFNSFQYVTKEDFIYYILFTMEQLKLNTEEIDLKLLGKISKEDALYQITYKYVRNVEILSNDFSFNKHVEIDNKIIRENLSLFHF